MKRVLVRNAALGAVSLLLGSSVQAAPPGVGVWQQIEPTAIAAGPDGKPHAPACSGLLGPDEKFSFWAKRGKSKNLVVYFEGGGACWNDYSCSRPLGVVADGTYVPMVPPGTPHGYGGIFDASHPANPVKDWSFVYIPYCTGDVHVGSRDRLYQNTGALRLPPVFNIQHRGFDNFMVVMDWVSKNVEKPNKVFVAGSSAGGYGASANFPWVQQVFPKARLSVLADASQGVLSQGFDLAEPGRKSWNPQLKADVFGSNVDALASPDILATAAAKFPRTRVAQFTTHFDEVQIFFHYLADAFNPPGANCANVAFSWHNQMVAGLLPRAASLPNFNYYVAGGSYHTILRSPLMYSESSTGRPFTDWLTALVKGDDEDGNVQPLDNQACPGCLVAPIPCGPAAL